MAFPLLRFVDEPSTTATVRLDLNPGTTAAAGNGVVSDGFTIGTPELEGEPGATGRRWGFRRLTMTLEVVGNRATALAAVADLARELLRRSNWLMFQPTSSAKPVWFRTWMTQPGEIDFENVRLAKTGDDARTSRWSIEVTLDADPWAYGARVTHASVTVDNDPTEAINPCIYNLPAISGDAPTPLRIRMGGDRRGDTSFLSVMASDDAQTTQLLAAASTPSTDTSVGGVTGAVGGTAHTVTFATQTGTVARLFYSGPTIRHGSYKVLARVKSSGSATIRAQLRFGTTTAAPALTDETFDVSTDFTYVQLGVLDWPVGTRVEDEFFATVSSNYFMHLWAGRVAGTGNLIVDVVALIPVRVGDDAADTLVVVHPDGPDVPEASFIDGDTRSVRLGSTGDAPMGARDMGSQEGEFPRAVPGVANTLRVFRTMDRAVGGDTIPTSTPIQVSYQPRWLYLADS